MCGVQFKNLSRTLASIERQGKKGESILGAPCLTQQLANDGERKGLENVGQKQEVGMMRIVSRRQEAELGNKASLS